MRKRSPRTVAAGRSPKNGIRGLNHHEHFQLIVEHAQDSIFIVGPDKRYVYANAFAAVRLGCPGGDMAGKSLKDVFSAEMYRRACQDIEIVFKTGKPLLREERIVFAQGDPAWVNTRLIPLRDQKGAVAFVMGISRDVTQAKLMEESLRESKGVYNALVSATPDAVTVTDLEGRILNVSRRTAEMHGFPRVEEMLSLNVFDLISGECRAAAAADMEKALQTGEARNMEHVLLRKDGSTFTGEVNCTLIRDAHGNPKTFIAVTRDITEHKKTARAIIEGERRFKELWDNAPVAYHIVNRDGVIASVNHTETRLLGYEVEEMVGKPVFDFILPEQREDARARFQQKIADKDLTRSDNRIYVRKDGSQLYVSIDDVLERDPGGAITGVRSTIVDVTERKKSEEKVRQSLEKLQTTMESIIQTMAKIVEMKDPYTSGHQKRVAQLATAIARELALPEEQVNAIHMASVIHDIGKIYVPAEILSKPGKLSEIEFDMIRTHPSVSYDILRMVEFPWPIARIVMQHHERMDGSGYPAGMIGEAIMLEARILSVADVVEAIAFHRPYRSAVGIDKALEEVESKKGILFDTEIVAACMRLFHSKGFSFTE